ncbi:hypothetical protein [Leuconostoc mesenteroides]|uniref:hypothetical protein n=1 Tax=Leuconostoc mesenteroides TaxID=1245 RepID=UPI0023614BC0|nr:hypothetical protein [Leuconostoc mesenteroides]
MEKIKQNKIWITILVIGIIVIGILLAMLHQQKQNSPEAQSSSYVSSAKASCASTSVQDKNNEKAYAKKAAKIKGHVLDFGIGNVYFTTWTKSDFVNWAKKYKATSSNQTHQNGVKESFGTTYSIENDNDTGDYPLDEMANQITSNGALSNYYETVKEFNKKNSGVNPNDIKK